MRLAVQPLKHSSLSLIHFCVLGFLNLWHYIPILLVLHIYLLSTACNDRTLSPGSLDHTYHPHLYYLTAYVHVFAPDSLPHLFHAVFARFGPCSLYSLIVSRTICRRICTIVINLDPSIYPPSALAMHVIPVVRKRTYL